MGRASDSEVEIGNVSVEATGEVSVGRGSTAQLLDIHVATPHFGSTQRFNTNHATTTKAIKASSLNGIVFSLSYHDLLRGESFQLAIDEVKTSAGRMLTPLF